MSEAQSPNSRVWFYDDDVNTDMLFPGKYTYTCSRPDEIRPHLLEDLDPEFAEGVQPGDIILAGQNFGCGSSREQPVVGLKAVGIEAIVAKSYARIFYRAAINQGLLLIECPEAVAAYKPGLPVELLLKESSIKVGDQTFKFPTLPPEILAIRDAGGLLEYTRARLRAKAGTK
jgi:3-isopropylmalate/(R)-2-methylmalate dehydratase small subunit